MVARFRPLNQEETSSAELSDVIRFDEVDPKVVNVRAALQVENGQDAPKSSFKFDKVFKQESTQA